MFDGHYYDTKDGHGVSASHYYYISREEMLTDFGAAYDFALFTRALKREPPLFVGRFTP